MPIESATDHGQKMPAPIGRAVGFVDTKSECDAVTRALNVVGIPDTKMIILHGEEGLQMLDRSAHDYFFADGENDLMRLAHDELNKSHFALFVEVSDQEVATLQLLWRMGQ